MCNESIGDMRIGATGCVGIENMRFGWNQNIAIGSAHVCQACGEVIHGCESAELAEAEHAAGGCSGRVELRAVSMCGGVTTVLPK